MSSSATSYSAVVNGPVPQRISLRGRLAEFFASFHRRLVDEAAADPEPQECCSAEWLEWQKRHWDRDRRRAELDEAEALTTYPGDPCPLLSEGLQPFIDWTRRQQARRTARRSSGRFE